MNALLKVVGVSCCCLMMGAVAADARDLRLTDGDLDRVVAGVDFPTLPPLLDNVPGSSEFPDIFTGPLNPAPPPPPPPPPPVDDGPIGPLPPDTGPLVSSLLQALANIIASGGLR